MSRHELVACHAPEEDAQAQLTALNIVYAEESRAVRYDHIDFTPPSGVREAAKKGLEWRKRVWTRRHRKSAWLAQET